MVARLRSLLFLLGAAGPLACGSAPNDKGGGDEVASYSCARCNLVLIVIDTLRADHLPCYGYSRDTTPVICSLGRPGVLFEEVIATSPWTKPSIASMLTGLYPKTHGALTVKNSLGDENVLLSEHLAASGYSTWAFSANGIAGPRFNFDQGYDRFQLFATPGAHTRSDEINEELLPFLESGPKEPFFIFVHYVDPHDPYTPVKRVFSAHHSVEVSPESFKAMLTSGAPTPLELLTDLYDDEILFNDGSVGAVLEALERGGLSERTVVVVTSDHGEELGEHGRLFHHQQLFDESLRVPLVMRLPGLEREVRIRRQISLVDVLPTLLDALGIEPPLPLQGTSQLGPSNGSGLAYAQLEEAGLEMHSVRSAEFKLIYPVQPSAKAVAFDLGSDPEERSNVFGAGPSRTRLRGLHQWLKKEDRPRPPEALDAEQLKLLRSLGYLDSADSSRRAP